MAFLISVDVIFLGKQKESKSYTVVLVTSYYSSRLGGSHLEKNVFWPVASQFMQWEQDEMGEVGINLP